jgi:altronate hydrolase
MNKYGCVLKINSSDNVAVALRAITKGETIVIDDMQIVTKQDIPVNHKVALRGIAKSTDVLKYGTVIGHATADISVGEHVHSHNMATNLGPMLDYSYAPKLTPHRRMETAEFMGYMRKDGSVGVRNEIWIIPTVGCANKIAENLTKEANLMFPGRTDGVFSFPHPYGCSQVGKDMSNTQIVLADLVRHPNAAGVLVLGLGCENNNIPEFKKILGEWDSDRVKFLSVQDVDDDEIEQGLKIISELVDYGEKFKRVKCPLSKLTVGLKCGGSDALSGITANPLLGRFSDMLIDRGGSCILTEVPEMFGAETFLMSRCENETVFNHTVELINGFKQYFRNHGELVSDNPSPGNKEGGITTLEEKSMGCIQKGGTQRIVDVLSYGEKVAKQGLSLLWGPGNDIMATTALTAAGVQIILFTTGRGTPLGAPVPTVKVSTNTTIYNRKHRWIDYNAGTLLDGGDTQAIENDFLKYVLCVASGEVNTNNELHDYREISIFKDGVTL